MLEGAILYCLHLYKPIIISPHIVDTTTFWEKKNGFVQGTFSLLVLFSAFGPLKGRLAQMSKCLICTKQNQKQEWHAIARKECPIQNRPDLSLLPGDLSLLLSLSLLLLRDLLPLSLLLDLDRRLPPPPPPPPPPLLAPPPTPPPAFFLP